MAMRPFVVGLMLAAALAGCSSNGSVGDGAGSNVPRETHAASWTPPAGTKPQAQPIEYALVSANGREITVAAFGGGCTVTAHLSATEAAGEVVLRLIGYEHTGRHIACPTNLIVWTRSVTLSEPLAGRRLVDGSTRKVVPFFDGRHLAALGWLPSRARLESNRPTGHGWERTYGFSSRHAAPIQIDQVYGDQLGGDQFAPDPMRRNSHLLVHGHAATLVTQPGPHGRLLEAFLGWVEHGYTITVESLPEYRWQRPYPPRVLEHIAREMRLPTATTS
jgi:hypothetical protein